MLKRAPHAHELLAGGEQPRRVPQAYAVSLHQRGAQGKLLGLARAGIKSRAQIDELKLQAAAAAEFVDLKVKGGVHPVADGKTAFTGGDGDQADPRNFNEAQYATRVQGLVEAMDANKKD